MIRNTLMLCFALIVLAIAGPVVFMVSLFRRDREHYIYNVALGLDQLGGSLLYNKVNWTISGYTHYMAKSGSKSAKKFEVFINWLFQDKDHCEMAFAWDLNSDAESEIR